MVFEHAHHATRGALTTPRTQPLNNKQVDALARKLLAAGKITDLCEDLGFYQRCVVNDMLGVRSSYHPLVPGASVLGSTDVSPSRDLPYHTNIHNPPNPTTSGCTASRSSSRAPPSSSTRRRGCPRPSRASGPTLACWTRRSSSWAGSTWTWRATPVRWSCLFVVWVLGVSGRFRPPWDSGPVCMVHGRPSQTS